MTERSERMIEEASYHLNLYLARSLDFSSWKMGSFLPISWFKLIETICSDLPSGTTRTVSLLPMNCHCRDLSATYQAQGATLR